MNYEITRTMFDGDIDVTATCPCCGHKTTVELIPEEEFNSWLDGNALIQDAFPDLESWEREVLLTGMCRGCQELFFGGHTEEEDF